MKTPSIHFLLVAVLCITGCRATNERSAEISEKDLELELYSIRESEDSLDITLRVSTSKFCKFTPVKVWMDLESVQYGNVENQKLELVNSEFGRTFSGSEVRLKDGDYHFVKIKIVRKQSMDGRPKLSEGSQYIYIEPYGWLTPISASYGSRFRVRLALYVKAGRDAWYSIYGDWVVEIDNEKGSLQGKRIGATFAGIGDR